MSKFEIVPLAEAMEKSAKGIPPQAPKKVKVRQGELVDLEAPLTESGPTKIPTAHWDRCPIKSRMVFGRGYTLVPFDSDCPSSLTCIGFSVNLAPQPSISETDTLARPESWSVKDVRQYNTQLAKRVPEVAGVYVPMVDVGSVCGACTRGDTVAIDLSQPQRTRRHRGLTEAGIRKLARKVGADAAERVRNGTLKVSLRKKGR